MKRGALIVFGATMAAACWAAEPSSTAIPPPSGPVGDWALKLPYPDNSAGWLRITRGAEGAAGAELMWRWTGPNQLVGTRYKGTVKLAGDTVEIRHLLTHWIRKSEDQQWSVMKGRAEGDRIEFTLEVTDGAGRVIESAKKITGARIPPPGPKPDLSRARFGAPVDLSDAAHWETRDKEWYFGWTFKDGVISNRIRRDASGKPAGKSANLTTKRRDFGDFRLRYEVRMQPRGNSGVYLRGRYEIQMEDSFGNKPGIHNMGALYGRIAPRLAAEKKAGEWQPMEITLYKRHLTVKLNGETIIDNEPVEGVTGGALDADDFAAGPIWLQGDHTDADYRKFTVENAEPETKVNDK